ncbi:VanZ family protein [Aliikangiella sp. IMCC44359]|uniref:VanZ family protein n=1 Tax=Aliikangiella sp. IMCC44359 TaxID=3459125 RepID=UPI00403AAC90
MTKINKKWLYLPISLLFGLLFTNSPPNQSSQVYQELWETGHLILFAGVIYILSHTVYVVNYKTWQKIGLTFIFCVLFGLITEVIQLLVGRNFEIKDIINDILGGYIGLTLSLLNKKNTLRINWLYFSIIIGLSISGGHQLILALNEHLRMKQDFPVLANFENVTQLKQWHHSHSTITLSKKIKQQGQFSMQVALSPAEYPNISLVHFIRNWQGYKNINFSIYNPSQETFNLILKIYDQEHNYQFDDRFNKTLSIAPGWTLMKQPLQEVENAPKNRKMQLDTIASFSLFMENPQQETTFYIDELYLSK